MEITTYRFNLRFQATTDDAVKVGEFLNSLGHKKSSVVVTAVAEYLKTHNIEKAETSTVSISKIEEIVERILAKKLDATVVSTKRDESKTFPSKEKTEDETKSAVIEEMTTEVTEEVTAMLANLGAFD